MSSLVPGCLTMSTPIELNTESAIQYAIDHNPGFSAAQLEVNKAAVRVRYTGKLDNPEIEMSYQSDRLFSNEGERDWSFSLNQRFPITGRLRLLKSISQLEVGLAEIELRNQRRILAETIEMIIAEIWHFEKQYELLTLAHAIEQEFRDFLKTRIETGEASRLDVNQIEVEVFNLDQKLEAMLEQKKDAEGRLKYWMGVAPEVDVLLETQVKEDAPQLDQDDLQIAALKQHPEVVLLRKLADIAASESELEMAQRWAEPSVKILFEESHSFDAPLGLQNNHFLGMGLSIPLPLHQSRRGSIEAKLLNEQQLLLKAEDSLLMIHNEAATKLEKIESVRRRLDAYEHTAMKLVASNLTAMNAAYAAGQTDLGELLRVQQQQLALQSEALELRFELRVLGIQLRSLTATNINPDQKS